MYVKKVSVVDWLASLDRLSIGSFYLLNVLARKKMDISDESLMKETALGLSTHRKYKRELIKKGYLTVEQIGRGEYQYSIGEPNE